MYLVKYNLICSKIKYFVVYLFLINYFLEKKMFCLRNSNFNYSCKHFLKIRNSRTFQNEVKKKRIFNFVLSRTLKFVQYFEEVFTQRFPRAMKVYRVFKVGTKDFYSDMKEYFKLSKSINNSTRSIENLSLKELDLYFQMPKDIMKVTPLLLVSLLPFANNVIFPLMYFFPRHLMCRHFWSLEQRTAFPLIVLTRRVSYYRPVFRALQLHLDKLQNNRLHCIWGQILGQIGSGMHPSALEILACLELFAEGPYAIKHLSFGHSQYLLKAHGLSNSIWPRKSLTSRAHCIHLMDLAIIKEGGPKSLNHTSLREALFLRGLNPINLKTDHATRFLSKWLFISKQVDTNSYSLLLHCPILIAYNHPTNWRLTHL